MDTLHMCLLLSGICISVSSAFKFRLWPLNERGTEGFVEVYHEGRWGYVGYPNYRFSDLSASYLCRTMQISEFGYGGRYTPAGSYKGFSWLSYIDCKTNGTCFTPAYGRGPSLDVNEQSYELRYGNSLHCVGDQTYDQIKLNHEKKVQYKRFDGLNLGLKRADLVHVLSFYTSDSKLVNGETHNVGILQTNVYGQIYTVCSYGFDMNAADVLCNHLGFHGAVSISEVDSDATPVYYKSFICDGSEYSLLQCNQSNDEILNCRKIVQITCKAVRLMSTNEYNDEGAVEIFYNGTWGFVGDPGFAVSDQTARYLCDKFGLGKSGFGARAHTLEDYDRIAWYSKLECLGNESHIFECDNDNPRLIPPLNNTYFMGSWLYCFEFNIRNVRLVNSSSYRDGRVQLEINGRWGSICTVDVSLNDLETAGNILCQTMGFRSVESVYIDTGKSTDLFWMSYVHCLGSETTISECHHRKGAHYPTPSYLGLICNDYNDCESNPCLNDGSCVDAFKNYSCECPRPWGGFNCETDIEDNCALGLCFNGATCVDRFEMFECHCVDGFDGELCQNNIDDCELMPCHNGGSCEDRINGYTCYCTDGFKGKQCQIVVADQTLLIVILASATSILLIVTVLTVCCCVRYRRRKGKRDKSRLDESKPTGQSDGTIGSEKIDDSKSDGYTNLYSTISVNLADYSTVKDVDDEDVYNVMKDTDIDIHSPPIQTADNKLKQDERGYISFETQKKETGKCDNGSAGDSILSQEYPSEITPNTNIVSRESYLIQEKAAASDGSYLSSNMKTFGTESVGPTDSEDYDDIEHSMFAINSQ